jgi:Methane oxygenase PmoA
MRRLLAALVLLGSSPVAEASGEVGFRETSDALEVTIDGKPFTTYRHGPGVSKPFFWPIVGPSGAPVTRAFPNVPDAPDETRDHLWHRGLSFTHGEVGVPGEAPVDFWREGAARQGRVVHRAFDPRPAVKDGVLTFGTKDDWLGPDGTTLLEDRVLWRIEDLGKGSALISSTIQLTSAGRPIRFGDSEEGSLAVRVATSMDEKSEPTGPRSKGPRGRITNSLGDIGASKCWGRVADWVDYSGPVDGRAAGLAIFDHPENRPRARWHVRDYGLFSANPFGQKVFKAVADPAPLTLEPGRALTLRYAVLVHPGDVDEGQVARRFEAYLRETPPVTVDLEGKETRPSR